MLHIILYCECSHTPPLPRKIKVTDSEDTARAYVEDVKGEGGEAEYVSLSDAEINSNLNYHQFVLTRIEGATSHSKGT